IMSCPFCPPDSHLIFYDEDPMVLCLWDAFPVTEGHALVVTRRHVSTWFEASRGEQASLLEGIEAARRAILRKGEPAGFNIGVNVGTAAGQTVPHLHVHVIPRYPGDVPDPRGGLRWVISTKVNYFAIANQTSEEFESYDSTASAQSVFVWGDQPLARALLHDLAAVRQVDIAVAFVLETGLSRIEPFLQDVIDRSGRVRFL